MGTESLQSKRHWPLVAPTAEDLMDSLWRFQDFAQQVHPEGSQERSRRTVQLYQRALDRYLEELPRVQISRSIRQRWWNDFGRQQELFWQMWQTRFHGLFEKDLETIWTDPLSRRFEKSIPLSAITKARLKHEFGNVFIAGSGQPVAHLVAEVRVIATDDADAQEYIRHIDIQLSPDSSGLWVTTSLPQVRPQSVQGTTIDLQLELPRECSLQAENTFGDLRVQDFINGVKASARHGQMDIRHCSGTLDLANEQGGVSVHDSKGDLHVETIFGPILVTQIQGNVFASNDFGDITVNGVSGSVEVKTSLGLIRTVDIGGDAVIGNRLGHVLVQGVAGDLTVNNTGAPVHIAGVSGETHVESQRGEVRAEKLDGDVIILNQDGNVELALDEIRQRLYRLNSSSGIVRVNLPAQPSAWISAETLDGIIDSDFPLEIIRVGSLQSARGKLGAGQAIIQLDGENSNIYLISSGR